jgi:hypothetical protein
MSRENVAKRAKNTIAGGNTARRGSAVCTALVLASFFGASAQTRFKFNAVE